jgi:hypothetical protein
MSPRRHLRLAEQPELFGDSKSVTPESGPRRRWVGRPWNGVGEEAYLAAVAAWTPY